jgi:maleate cis-trans isomerase
MSDEGYSLALPFDTDNEEFVRGVEIGRLWEKLKNEDGIVIETIHLSNAEMVIRIAEALERPVVSEEIDDTWMTVTFTHSGGTL